MISRGIVAVLGRDPPVMHSREEGLERKLQRFISGATGCFLDVELRLTQVGLLDPTSGRGTEMPAILMAAITHQRGRRHVTASADEEAPSPSGVVENWFRQGLRTGLGSAVAGRYWQAVEALASAPLRAQNVRPQEGAAEPAADFRHQTDLCRNGQPI